MARASILPLALALLALAVHPARATTLVVSTIDDLSNGDTSCPSALIANPGPDGISLREAITAINNASSCGSAGPHTIAFAPALAGQTIAPTQPYKQITQAGVTIAGLADGNGQPTVTIDASLLPANSLGLFAAAASNFSLISLHLTGFAAATPQERFGIHVQPNPSAPDNNVINNITISGNVFTGDSNRTSSVPVSLGSEPNLGSGNVMSGITISGNTFTNFLGTDAIRIPASGANSTVENIVISQNAFTNAFVAIELVTGNTSGNRLLHTQIAENTFLNCASALVIDIIGSAGSPVSTSNQVDDTLISGNALRGGTGAGILLLGGASDPGPGTQAVGNTISNTRIVNNLITGRTQFGPIGIQGGASGSAQNVISGVSIVNNTIANNPTGTLSAIAADANLSGGTGNVVSGVSITNSLFSGNPSDFGGSVAVQVQNSLTCQAGFAGNNRNVCANPVFINPAAGDFHIQASSPAKGAGTSIGAPANDLDCVARPNPPAIGAYEPGESGNCARNVVVAVTEPGAGSGQVTSSPAGINCSASGSQCSASFASGQQVTLTASAGANSSFSGWSGGGCSGISPCTLMLSGNATVAANFLLNGFTLSIAPSGTGSGAVTSNPSGINCGATCSASFAAGTQVVLSAVAAPGSTFAGWAGGGCGGLACTVTITSDTTVVPTFVQNVTTKIALVAAVLPLSRSVEIGGVPATAFATIINPGPGGASVCSIAPTSTIPASFAFQTTDPRTNALSGTSTHP